MKTLYLLSALLIGGCSQPLPIYDESNDCLYLPEDTLSCAPIDRAVNYAHSFGQRAHYMVKHENGEYDEVYR